MIIHRGVRLTRAQEDAIKQTLIDGMNAGLSTKKLEVAVDAALEKAGLALTQEQITIAESAKPKRPGRKLAPEDTKAGIQRRHGAEMCKVLNDRERLKGALAQLLRANGVPEGTINEIITDVRAANFESLEVVCKKVIG